MEGGILRPVPVLCSGNLYFRVLKWAGEDSGEKTGSTMSLEAYSHCMHDVLWSWWKTLNANGVFQTMAEEFACSLMSKECNKVQLHFFSRLLGALAWVIFVIICCTFTYFAKEITQCPLFFFFQQRGQFKWDYLLLSCKADTGNLSSQLVQSRKCSVPLLY